MRKHIAHHMHGYRSVSMHVILKLHTNCSYIRLYDDSCSQCMDSSYSDPNIDHATEHTMHVIRTIKYS